MYIYNDWNLIKVLFNTDFNFEHLKKYFPLNTLAIGAAAGAGAH
jgi:hypothetical protein